MTTFVDSEGPYERVKVIDGASMEHTAIIKGSATRCKSLWNVRYQIEYTVTGVPVGAIGVEFCETGLESDFVTYPLNSDQVKIITGDGALNGTTGVVDINGVGAGYVTINLTDVYGYLRPFYTSVSDGTGATITAHSGAR